MESKTLTNPPASGLAGLGLPNRHQQIATLLAKAADRCSCLVYLWDGSVIPIGVEPQFVLNVTNRAGLDALRHPSSLSLGAAYVAGDIDVDGDIEKAIQLANCLVERRTFSAREQIGDLAAAVRMMLGMIRKSAIGFHYDENPDFFGLWLDRRKIYSCGYFRSPSDDLDTAQEQKLKLVCRKLALQPMERFCDLGCGWGGLVHYAEQEFGARSHGITLSPRQAEAGKELIRSVSGGATITCGDFLSDIGEGQYDKIASLGAIEHVPPALLGQFFRNIYRRLRPGGLFLLQSITQAVNGRIRPGSSFLDRFAFPGARLVPVTRLLSEAESAGFEVRDVECLREHYAMTNRIWHGRLKSRETEAIAMCGKRTYRTFLLWQAGFASEFASGRLGLYQMLLSRSDSGTARVHLTRESWLAND
jgi:cyclopropane-fatty-acyl-phospholipid synthase